PAPPAGRGAGRADRPFGPRRHRAAQPHLGPVDARRQRQEPPGAAGGAVRGHLHLARGQPALRHAVRLPPLPARKPAARPGPPRPEVDASRRRFLSRAAAGGAVAATAGLAGYGLFRAYAPAEVTELPVKLAGLPRALDGFTIVQVSDIHVGPTIGRRFLDD